MSRRASLQYPQPQQLSNQLLLQPPRLTTLSTMARTQRLGSQPTLLYSNNPHLMKSEKGVAGTSSLAQKTNESEKMPQHLGDHEPEHIPRQQRRSQPSIFATEMHPQLIAAKSGPLGHSQPMLYCYAAEANKGSYEHIHSLKTPPLIQRAHNSSNSSSKTGSPSTGRKLPRPPPERRVLRRSPQSDLFPRFQQHRQQLEASPITQFPNELIQTKLEPSEFLYKGI